MTSPVSIRPGDYVPTADRRFILREVGWAGYQQVLQLRGERKWRIAYLDGAVQMMAPSRGHDDIGRKLAALITHYCLEQHIEIHMCGSWLLDDKSGEAALEPDESFVLGADPGHTRPRPDLAIEVIWTHGGLDKLEIYQRLGVGEVWMWRDDVISVHILQETGYERRHESACLPDLDLALIARLCRLDSYNAVIAGLREWLARDR